MLLGNLTFFGENYIFMETSFVKNSRQFLLVSEYDITEQDRVARLENYYRANGQLDPRFLICMLDPTRKKQYGPTQAIQLLDSVYRHVQEIMRKSRLAGSYRFQLGEEIYETEDSLVRIDRGLYKEIIIRTDNFSMTATYMEKLNIKSRVLNGMLGEMSSGTAKYNTATFLDASMEYLERQGFDFSWMVNKDYVPIHSVEDWDNLLMPALIKEFVRWKREKDFPYFLVSIDFESTGLQAYCEKAPIRDKSVFFSISFADDQSFGVFLDMENFDNADTKGIAERLTYLAQRDPIEDRELTLRSGIHSCTLNRSELTIAAHNMMIDRRFGFLIEADIWFDLCTHQLSFNLDPFMTQGINGLKYIVEKFFGIVYADLTDICGKKNQGMFKYLSDKRVVMMYGCADTDLHRLAAKKMILGVKECISYFGVDHVEQHMKLDAIYMNSKADNDYQGLKIDLPEFKKLHMEQSRILALYHDFMAQYVGRVQAYKNFEYLVLAAQRNGVELEDLKKPNLDNTPPYNLQKWSGDALIKVLFEVLGYPKLVWTTQNKKAKLAGKPFKPKLAVNTDAIKYYLKIKASVTEEQIEQALTNQHSLEDLKWAGMYLKTDYVDPVTKKVLIEKEKFNSYRLPFFYVLLKISNIVKILTAELNPVVEANSDYKFNHCNTTSAVTRRDLNPNQTVSAARKYHYLPYDDSMNMCDVDQSAVEIRILYGLSKDESLIQPINNPEKDSHTETAALMHQIPAYQVSKKVRKGIKFLAFGRPYGKEVYSSCRDFFGDNSPEHMAEMAYLFELYDNKLASVMKVLTKVRDEMDNPVNAPEWLRWYLEMDPEKEYGRMINDFGYTQHMEIRRSDEGFRQSMRRKAGNFIIQGYAANFIRILYVRLFKRFWSKGWIQNRLIRLHLTVHDEILFSYSKNLNPVEVMVDVHETLTVKVPGFPTFFVGINFGHNWGEAKDDNSELPVLLVEEMRKAFKAGEYSQPIEEDHIHFFTKKKKKDYLQRRVLKELKSINNDKNVWDLEHISKVFENYTVRAMLPDAISDVFPIPKGVDPRSFKVADDCEDPIQILGATLPKFIARFVVPQDSRTHYIIYKKKAYKVVPEMGTEVYDGLEDLLNNRPQKKDGISAADTSTSSLELDVDVGDLEFEEEVDLEFDFNPNDSADDLDSDGIANFSSDFLLQYNRFDFGTEEKIEYGSVEARVKAETSPKKHSFTNFKVQNKSIILSIAENTKLVQVKKFCVGNTTSNLDSLKLYVKHGGNLIHLGNYTEAFLITLDEALTNNFKSTKTG